MRLNACLLLALFAVALPARALASASRSGAARTSAARAAGPRDAFLDEVQHRAFLFFWKETDPVTGLTKDRAHNFAPDTYDVGSTAATGFALTAACIGAERGWVSHTAARNRVLLTLRWLDADKDVIHGLYPHFITFKTGARAWKSEYSTIDTTLLLCGALTAGEYFGGEAKTIAQRLYRRVDWVYWSPRGAICHGSRPEEAEFLPHDYSGYSEALLMYVIAIGSPTHPSPAGEWRRLGRWIARYGPYSSIAGPALFVNQYPNLWVEFRGKHDGIADYWQNARADTLANRQFCIDQMGKYRTYGPDVWGLTAGDGPDGYRAYGAEPGGAYHDGTVNPHAAGGSFMFTPVESRRALAAMRKLYGPKVWGRYGFSDGFNVDRNWWAQDVIGIDTGATLLSIENARTGLVHRLFMRTEAARNGMRRIGFTPVPSARGSEPIRAAGAAPLTAGALRTVTFRLPKRPAGWGSRPILLYGGVVEERTVRISLNGTPLGAASAPKGLAYPAAIAVPPGRLRWGRTNTLTLTLDAGKPAWYGPVWLGPREGLDFRPLKVRTAR